MTLTTDRPRRSELGTTVGYIQLAGPVFVGLLGCVYNTSVEVGQHLDLEAALENLARCHRGDDG